MLLYIILINIYINYCDGMLPQEILDIRSPNELIEVNTTRVQPSILFTSYIPIRSARILRVVDRNIIIWTNIPNVDRRCIRATLHENDINVAVLSLDILNSDGSFSYSYFKLSSSIWSTIGIYEHLSRLYVLMSERHLDINKGSPIAISDELVTHFGNSSIEFTVLPTFILVKITENNDIIWERTLEDEMCAKAIAYYRRGISTLLYAEIHNVESINSKCFRKLDNNWVEIPIDIFSDIRNKLTSEYKLDVNSVDTYGCFCITNYEQHGLPALMFTAEANIQTTEVVSNEENIWNSPDGIDKCTMAVAHLKDNGPILVHLYIKTPEPSDGNRYFMKLDDGNWIETSKEEFYTKLEEYDEQHERENI